MSDPNRPPTETLSAMQQRLASGLPDTYKDTSPQAVGEMADFERKSKDLEYLQRRLAASKLDMALVPTVVLEREFIGSADTLKKNGELLACTDSSPISYRARTAAAKDVVNAFYAEVPESGPFLPHTKEGIKARNDKYLYVRSGVQHTVGRLAKAYPKENSRIRAPPTRKEVDAALRGCGVDVKLFDPMVRGAFPLNPKPDDDQMYMNMKADNGFPVGGTMEDPTCAKLVLKLAVDMRVMFVNAFKAGGRDGVYLLVRQMEERRPCLVAVKGKAKADMYSKEKIGAHMVRFYNAFPRQIVMNMQMSTQRLEALKRSILYVGHSAAGMSLVHGGADKLVAALQGQLDACGAGYVHMGDDTLIALTTRFGVLLFSLDCSNFDLTQHGSVTKEVHAAIADELALIDPTSAAVWYAFARERVVVVMRTLARRFRHAGPSGMPLQSTVNDVLMEILCARLLAKWPRDGPDFEVLEKTDADTLIQEVGGAMGFSVRLEDYDGSGASTIKGQLAAKPFLFIGYRFYVHRSGMVAVYADVPRAITQMQYPTTAWIPDRKDLCVYEAVRLASVIMSMGIPPPELVAAHEAARKEAALLLERAISGGLPKHLSQNLDQQLLGGTIGFDLDEKSVRGLAKALERDPYPLWLYPKQGQSEEQELTQWADMVEQLEEQVSNDQGISLVRPKAGPLPKSSVLYLPPFELAHPATTSNDGRPPPTARWAPDKSPRPETGMEFFPRPSRGGKKGQKGKRGEAAVDFGESDAESYDSVDDYY